MKLREPVPLVVASLLTLAGCGASKPSSIEAGIANEV